MAQGYVLQNNFFESQTGASDRGILDNLSYVGATNDILLFDGNLRAVSTLKAIESPVVELTDFTFNTVKQLLLATQHWPEMTEHLRLMVLRHRQY
jgi:hypothetical protein